ncbi:hypothetical protein AVEN_100698-1 [Araneus ventricosus]|uniref:Uncharacterized protein n=1 Tax=Araneus ventricosus TaxID=182803 RepID=A0A4Y2CSV7_ARAVE|nr:hypothetical protein AVEN_100698-1 [Araneus ventricosus]
MPSLFPCPECHSITRKIDHSGTLTIEQPLVKCKSRDAFPQPNCREGIINRATLRIGAMSTWQIFRVVIGYLHNCIFRNSDFGMRTIWQVFEQTPILWFPGDCRMLLISVTKYRLITSL